MEIPSTRNSLSRRTARVVSPRDKSRIVVDGKTLDRKDIPVIPINDLTEIEQVQTPVQVQDLNINIQPALPTVNVDASISEQQAQVSQIQNNKTEEQVKLLEIEQKRIDKLDKEHKERLQQLVLTQQEMSKRSEEEYRSRIEQLDKREQEYKSLLEKQNKEAEETKILQARLEQEHKSHLNRLSSLEAELQNRLAEQKRISALEAELQRRDIKGETKVNLNGSVQVVPPLAAPLGSMKYNDSQTFLDEERKMLTSVNQPIYRASRPKLPQIPRYDHLTPAEQSSIRAEFRIKFNMLRTNWPTFTIPELPDSLPLEQWYIEYSKYIQHIHISNSAEKYRFIMVFVFLGMELGVTKFLGIDASEFAVTQLKSMSNYDRMLIELGEKYYSANGSSQWPVEITLIFSAGFNLLIFLALKWLSSKVGPDAAKGIMDAVKGLISGNSPIQTQVGQLFGQPTQAPAPTASAIPNPPAPVPSVNSANIMGIGIPQAVGFAANMFGGTPSAGAASQPAAPADSFTLPFTE